MLSLIVAHTRNMVIGKDGGMPWHLPADLAHFKSTTLGHPVIMGRKTFESIGRALPGRKNIVISTNPRLVLPEGVIKVDSVANSLEQIAPDEEAFIMGGGTIYKSSIDMVDRLYLTIIEAEIEGDTYFPNYDLSEFREIERSERKKDDKNAYDLTFVTLERIK